MYKILIAEDEFIERIILKKTLNKYFGMNCEIFEVENGKQAVEVFREREVDLIILDVEMPGLKGTEAAAEMRKSKKDFHLIFLTAYERFDFAKKAISVKAAEYLLKPYSEQELVNVVGSVLKLGPDIHNKESDLNEDIFFESKNNVPSSDIYNEINSGSNVVITLIEEYVKRNFMNEISTFEAAKILNYSEPYFCKVFKQHFGQSFTSYLTEFRMEEAKKLLVQPNVSVKEVGLKVGYNDNNYFSRVFKKKVGLSPSSYRRKVLKEMGLY